MSSLQPLNRCTYYLEKKRRICRLMAKKGSKFCGEHLVFDTKNTSRVICPNDIKHSVSVNELEEHLKSRCNARLLSFDYISHNFNCSSNCSTIFCRPEFYNLIQVAKIVETVYDRISVELILSVLKTEQVEEHLRQFGSALSKTSKKHFIQLSSIIGHILFSDLLHKSQNNCLIELGSGKAQLSYWLMNIFPECSFLLVDKTGARNKFDNKAFRENEKLKVQRLRCCIEHLNLSKVDFIKSEDHVITAVCKHLCGNATDYGINCVLNARKNGVKFSGFAFAPCCHHRTLMNQYVGADFLKSVGLSEEHQFAALRHICSWSTCGFDIANADFAENKRKKIEADFVGIGMENEFFDKIKNWSTDYKIGLGRKAKLLLEYGRAEFLRRTTNIKVNIFAYVEPEVSPENILLIGKFL